MNLIEKFASDVLNSATSKLAELAPGTLDKRAPEQKPPEPEKIRSKDVHPVSDAPARDSNLHPKSIEEAASRINIPGVLQRSNNEQGFFADIMKQLQAMPQPPQDGRMTPTLSRLGSIVNLFSPVSGNPSPLGALPMFQNYYEPFGGNAKMPYR